VDLGLGVGVGVLGGGDIIMTCRVINRAIGH
jgi:hypothetical protein